MEHKMHKAERQLSDADTPRALERLRRETEP